MHADVIAWLGLLLRWLHVIVGIAWIGSSFYFVWLDNSLEPPATKEDKAAGVSGELWAVHGGGFYHKKKYNVAPDHMPDHLHWFKWEAYFTFISGFLLLCVVYYAGASLYLIDKAKMPLEPLQASVIGIGFIIGGWVFYDTLCRSWIGRHAKLFTVIWFGALAASAYALGHIFSGRGAFIHVGAMIGTAMAANVFAVIIPNQKKVVADLLAHRKPDPRLGQIAKQRSMHNNYMTLPVLLIMISNHYPMLYSGPHSWLILSGLAASAWPIRQFFNLKHKGKVDYRYPLAGAIGIVIVMLGASGVFSRQAPQPKGAKEVVTAAEVRRIVRTHCSACHSDTPVHPGIDVAPAGVMFDTMAEIRQYAPRIRQQAVEGRNMPLGNETGMTAQDREKLGRGLDAPALKGDTP
ncbi:MAG: hypothetical protein GC185_13170 [Alphaproteobacteria bacterium]|nr:hypothetical protein [Alphaproteobacteria bacterium]